MVGEVNQAWPFAGFSKTNERFPKNGGTFVRVYSILGSTLASPYFGETTK